MRSLDPTRPVVHIHIPKTGGTTVRSILRARWPRLNEDGQCYSEHFDSTLGFTVESFTGCTLPDVQMVVFLRDPFEQALSFYAYWQSATGVDLTIHGQTHTRPETLAAFLQANLLDWFAFLPGCRSDYPEALRQFAFVSLMPYFTHDARRLARWIGLPRTTSIPRLLDTRAFRRQASYDGLRDLRESYIAAHPDECALYEYACDLRAYQSP